MHITAETAISLVGRAMARQRGRENWRDYDARSGMADVEYAMLYGEPGYSDPPRGILFANWNAVPRALGDALERRGFECEWSDEWTIAHETGKAYRTSPDCYGWTPYYVITDDGDIIGGDEIESGDETDWYVNEYLVNDPTRCNVFKIDLASFGFEQFNGTFESGLHPGQNDSPHKVLEQIRAERGDNVDVVFSIESVGQFDSHWTAWVREQEVDQ